LKELVNMKTDEIDIQNVDLNNNLSCQALNQPTEEEDSLKSTKAAQNLMKCKLSAINK
jgi:hypothetical protein